MRNLSGYLKKTLLLFSCLLIFLLSTSSLLAAQQNNTYLDISYSLFQSGDLKTDLKFTIENNSIIPTVVNYYTISLPYSNVSNLAVIYKGRKLERSIHKQSVGSDVVVNFDSAVIPVNSQLTFTASFSTAEFIDVSKEVAYLSFPNTFPDISVNSVVINLPSDWASVAWASGLIKSNQVKDKNRIIEFRSPTEEYLNLVLGETLSYGFRIDKVLTNADTQEKFFDVSLPPWNENQRVLFSNISPPPNLVTEDKEGNTTFSYLVKKGQSLKVSIEGEIMLIEGSSKLDIEKLGEYLIISGYWKLDNDSEYVRAALFLKNKGLNINSTEGAFNDLKSEKERELFVKEVYNYVIERFKPAQASESSQENPLRAGASQALKKEGGAVPEDYVDLLISILRHFGVPSRMVVGYVPESAGYKAAGFFHSWLEYWDQDGQRWKTLDPALDDSAEASLYNKPLGDHITLLQRGNNSILPKLTYFSDSEFIITNTLSQMDEHVNAQIDLLVNSAKLTSKYIQADLKVTNTGNVPVKVSNLKLLNSENDSVDIQILSSLNDSVIVPGAEVLIPVSLSNLATESITNDLRIDYSLVDPLGWKTSTVGQINVEIVSYWWWNWLIKLISFILFTAGFWIMYQLFKRVKKIWQ